MCWQEKTCENCQYRIEEVCRRFPPTIENDMTKILNKIYPQVRMGKYGYQRACGEFKEKL